MKRRILHVLGGMNRGGVEAWLIQLLRSVDRQRFQLDFLVHTDQPCQYDDEVRSLGSEILPCLRPAEPRRYARNFRSLLAERPAYDVIHSHVAYFSGCVLRLAKSSRIPVRIAHSHTDRIWLENQAGWRRHAYIQCMRRMIDHYATHRFAVSTKAAHSLFGRKWRPGTTDRIIYYGVDFARFELAGDRAAVRSELGFTETDWIVGHVGNFVRAKNHERLIRVAAIVCRHDPAAKFLFVGDGPLRASIEAQARDAGIADRVVFLGSRGDVPRLMRFGMDVFVFPSNFEGLGLVAIEAQASGLPCVLSDVIPHEVDVIPAQLTRVAPSHSLEAWAEAILQYRHFPRPSDSLALLRRSAFAEPIATSVIESIYDDSPLPVAGGVTHRNARPITPGSF